MADQANSTCVRCGAQKTSAAAECPGCGDVPGVAKWPVEFEVTRTPWPNYDLNPPTA